MADVKISALPLATTPLAGTEVLPIVQSATTDQVSVANLTAGRAVSAASLTLTTTPLAVGSGGTGLTSLTAGYIPYASSSSALSFSTPLWTDGTSVGIGTTSVLGNSKLSVLGKITTDTAVSGDVICNLNNNSATGYGLRVGGGASGSGYALSINNYAGTELLQLNGAGNLGLGVTPSAWVTNKAFQLPSGSVSDNQSGILYYTQNGYFGSGGWTYSYAAAAAQYRQSSGQHQWFNAASGTAGNAITFTQAMTLEASGNLLVGTTSSQQKVTVGGNIAIGDGTNFPTLISTTNGLSISTTATTIFSNASAFGMLVVVRGSASGPAQFSDLVFAWYGGCATISGGTVVGSPAARTYTCSGGNLKLAMASGTYTIWATAIMEL